LIEGHDLPQGWIWTTLGTIAKVNPGIDTSTVQDTILVSFVPMAAVEAGTGKMNAAVQRQLKDVRHGYTAFQERDVLFAKITPCMENGKSVVAHSLSSGIGFGSTEFHVLRILAKMNPYLIYYYISQYSFRKDARSHMAGTAGQLRVPTSYLAEVPFPLAPSSEQERIVAAIEQQLSRVDAGVALFRQAQKKLKQYRASVLKSAVEGTLTAEWRAEHPDLEPASELLKRILKERRAKWEEEQRAKGRDPQKMHYVEPAKPDVSGLQGLPEGWCWATLEQISDENRAITYGVVKLGDSVPGGIPTLRSSNIRHLRLDTDEIKSISPEIANSYKRTFLQGGEILVTVRGTLGGVISVPEKLSGYNISREVAMIACVLPSLSRCLAIFIASPPMQNWLQRHTKGITYVGINIETLKNVPFSLAPLAEQEQIVSLVEERLSLANALEKAIGNGLKRAERERQSILHQAFTGQLVPQNPDDEPASVLLERIRKERSEREKQAKQGQRIHHEKRASDKRKPEALAEARPIEFVQPELIEVNETVQGELWQTVDAN
jgi:type I restriction enzyme S subunit